MPPPSPPAADTREKLKAVAQRLLADRGIDGVAVRDIVDTASAVLVAPSRSADAPAAAAAAPAAPHKTRSRCR